MVYFSSLYLDNYFRCAILANQNKNRTLIIHFRARQLASRESLKESLCGLFRQLKFGFGQSSLNTILVIWRLSQNIMDFLKIAPNFRGNPKLGAFLRKYNILMLVV